MAKKNKQGAKQIGIKVSFPKEKCDDMNCPFHGKISLRGKVFTGVVQKDKMQKSVVVSWERRKFNKKYERYEKRKTAIKAHNPPCVNAKEGDIVKIMECRPISKMISSVIVEVVDKDKQFYSKVEGKEESRIEKDSKKDKEEKAGEQ